MISFEVKKKDVCNHQYILGRIFLSPAQQTTIIRISAHFGADGIKRDYCKLVEHKPVDTFSLYFGSFCPISQVGGLPDQVIEILQFKIQL